MPCLTRTPSRGPFVLARTVVLVSALALLGYLPLANPLTSPSRRERPTGNFAKQNCRIVLAFSAENVSPFGWRLCRHTSPSPSLGVRASGLNCFCRNLKHFSPKGCRSSEKRFARTNSSRRREHRAKAKVKYGGVAATRRARHFLLKMRVQYDNFAKQNCP